MEPFFIVKQDKFENICEIVQTFVQTALSDFSLKNSPKFKIYQLFQSRIAGKQSYI